MKFFLFSILLFSTGNLFGEGLLSSCLIEAYPKFIAAEKNIALNQHPFKKSSCSTTINRIYVDTISNLKGVVNANQISEIINEKLPDTEKIQISLFPIRIEIISAAELLKNSIAKNSEFVFKDVKMISNISLIPVENDEIITATCSNCETVGQKSINLVKSSTKNDRSENYWVSATVAKVAVLLRAKKYTKAFESNLINAFETVPAPVENEDKYFTDIESLKFYSLNRPIQQSQLLLKSDLTPVPLVTAGSPVKILLDNGNMKLKFTGIARKSAYYGQDAEIINNTYKKVIVGKTVDFNTILVEL